MRYNFPVLLQVSTGTKVTVKNRDKQKLDDAALTSEVKLFLWITSCNRQLVHECLGILFQSYRLTAKDEELVWTTVSERT